MVGNLLELERPYSIYYPLCLFMINPKDQAALDQAISGMREIMPSLWRSLYDGCIEKGFTEAQAMTLVCTYITTAYRSNNAPSA